MDRAGRRRVEFGNSRSGTVGSFVETFDVRTRFFDQVNLAFYPLDNLELYAGHRYLAGRNAAAFGGEWGVPMGNGVMAALFAEARVGRHSDHGAWGGLRFYFGQKDKTLIRRHREDDPTIWDNGADSTFAGGSSQTTATTSPAPPFICPAGFILVGGVCVGL